MRIHSTLAAIAATVLLTAAPLSRAAEPAEEKPAPTMQQVLDASKPSDWRPLDPNDTLYMDLPQGRVVIELASAYAPLHGQNIRALAHEH
jgi:peptidylprolyl isomerase